MLIFSSDYLLLLPINVFIPITNILNGTVENTLFRYDVHDHYSRSVVILINLSVQY